MDNYQHSVGDTVVLTKEPVWEVTKGTFHKGDTVILQDQIGEIDNGKIGWRARKEDVSNVYIAHVEDDAVPPAPVAGASAEQPLQVGDVIRCIKGDGWGMEEGKEYTISQFPYPDNNKVFYVDKGFTLHGNIEPAHSKCDYVLVRRANEPSAVTFPMLGGSTVTVSPTAPAHDRCLDADGNELHVGDEVVSLKAPNGIEAGKIYVIDGISKTWGSFEGICDGRRVTSQSNTLIPCLVRLTRRAEGTVIDRQPDEIKVGDIVEWAEDGKNGVSEVLIMDNSSYSVYCEKGHRPDSTCKLPYWNVWKKNAKKAPEGVLYQRTPPAMSEPVAMRGLDWLPRAKYAGIQGIKAKASMEAWEGRIRQDLELDPPSTTLIGKYYPVLKW